MPVVTLLGTRKSESGGGSPRSHQKKSFQMESKGDSKKLMEKIERKAVDRSEIFERLPIPSPSRKRKGKGLSGDGATLKELSADEASLSPELTKWIEEGLVRAVAQIIRTQYDGLDMNSSEGKQVFRSMINSIKKNVASVLDSLKFNCQEHKLNVAQFVESNRRTMVGLSESMAKVEAMDVDTSAMEEQAPGVGSGITLEMEAEMLPPVATDDNEEELVGLDISMFSLPADPTPINKSAAELDEMDRESSGQLAHEATEMVVEQKNFNRYINIWESQWGSNGCGSFPDMTTLSSMQLAHLIPGAGPSDIGRVSTTLQVHSIKLSDLKGGLQWPLRVYGMVAVRDSVDHDRNVLFARDSTVCQIVTEDDPYLCLIGPSRAIVFKDGVVFEIQLKLGANPISRDRSLISGTRRYYVGYGTISFENCFCTTEVRVRPIERSVQATILGIRVKDGAWPSLYGGVVYCFAPPHGETEQEDQKLVLHDSHGRRMHMSLGGHLHLSRHVVSVEVESCLKFILQTYSSLSGDMGERSTVSFGQRFSNTSRKTCCLGGREVEITVAWSRLVAEKQDIALKGWVGMGRDD